MQAVILAGGLGKRLRPLTENIPKPMVTVLGKPYLEYQINWLRSNKICKVLLLTGYLGEKIESYFGDGSLFGVDITYSQEPEALGTGGGLKYAEDKLENRFILIYGDSFLPLIFSDLINHFLEINKTAVVVVCDNNICDTGVMNNILLDKNGLIMKYKKNSRDEDLNYVEAGVMVFNKNIVDLIPNNKVVSLEEEFFPILINKKELNGYISDKIFYDIGTEDRLKRFEKIVQSNIFNFL